MANTKCVCVYFLQEVQRLGGRGAERVSHRGRDTGGTAAGAEDGLLRQNDHPAAGGQRR